MGKALAEQGINEKSQYFQLCCESKTKIFLLYFFLTPPPTPPLKTIYLFLAELGLCCFAQAFSHCRDQWILHYSTQVSHCSGFSCWGAQALGA